MQATACGSDRSSTTCCRTPSSSRRRAARLSCRSRKEKATPCSRSETPESDSTSSSRARLFEPFIAAGAGTRPGRRRARSGARDRQPAGHAAGRIAFGGERRARRRGRSSRSRFRWPTHRARSTRATPVPRPGQKRILVVEDNEDVADSLVYLLELMGFEVKVAHDGPSAVSAAVDGLPGLHPVRSRPARRDGRLRGGARLPRRSLPAVGAPHRPFRLQLASRPRRREGGGIRTPPHQASDARVTGSQWRTHRSRSGRSGESPRVEKGDAAQFGHLLPTVAKIYAATNLPRRTPTSGDRASCRYGVRPRVSLALGRPAWARRGPGSDFKLGVPGSSPGGRTSRVSELRGVAPASLLACHQWATQSRSRPRVAFIWWPICVVL